MKKIILLFLAGVLLTACNGANNFPLSGAAGVLSGDAVGVVSDVTMPDGSEIAPGKIFTKTWKLYNNGTTTWTANYDLVFYGGHHMSGALETPLTKDVLPGESVEVSINLIAPVDAGDYTGYWMLRNVEGKLFGWGEKADQSFWTMIKVSNDAKSESGSDSPPGGKHIQNMSLVVDQPLYSGTCPMILNFSGMITVSGTNSMVYQFEAGSTQSGFSFYLPDPVRVNYNNSEVQYQSVLVSLEITNSVNGWVNAYVSEPESVRSEKVFFSVTCQ